MHYKVITAPKAEADLDQIYIYITKTFNDPESAEKITSQILDKIDTLELFPRRGDIFTEAKPKFGEIRTIKTKIYLILYAISDHPPVITIHRIIHAHRNLSIIL